MTAGTAAFSSPDLTWTGDLAVGASATVTYSVTVSSADTGPHVLTNIVTSATAGNNCPAGGTDPRCSVTVDIAALTIVNTASVSTTTPGSTVAYAVTVTNTGQTLSAGVSVTDPLTGVLDDAAFGNDATTSSGSVTYASPNLTWTGDLAPGAAAIITFSVTVHNPATGDKSLISTVTSAAAGNNCPAGGADPRCTATVGVLTPALAITKTARSSTTTPGSTVGYTITVADTGQTPYTDVDRHRPARRRPRRRDLPQRRDRQQWRGQLRRPDADLDRRPHPGRDGDHHLLDNGEQSRHRRQTPHQHRHLAAPGSNCPPASTDPACTATVIDLVPALIVTKTATVSTTTPGSTVGYTITVADTGQTPYAAAQVTDTLAGVLGDAAYNGNATASEGTISL